MADQKKPKNRLGHKTNLKQKWADESVLEDMLFCNGLIFEDIVTTDLAPQAEHVGAGGKMAIRRIWNGSRCMALGPLLVATA